MPGDIWAGPGPIGLNCVNVQETELEFSAQFGKEQLQGDPAQAIKQHYQFK